MTTVLPETAFYLSHRMERKYFSHKGKLQKEAVFLLPTRHERGFSATAPPWRKVPFQEGNRLWGIKFMGGGKFLWA